MLRGATELNLDAKGRMALPASERERIRSAYGSGEMILTINFQERCLWLYPLEEWDRIEKTLTSLSSLDKNIVRMKRLLLGHAKDCSLDGQGRIAISPFLREYAGLQKKVVVMGQGNKYEIWDSQTFNTLRDQWIEEQASMEDMGDSAPDVPL